MLFNKIYPVTCHTDHVGPDTIFVAIKGHKEDGTKYIETAIQKGAKTIVLEKNSTITKHSNINYIFVDDSRIALAELAAEKLGNPSTKLKFIGITGTCGKTTTTYLVEHILKHAGNKTALLGSIKNKILDRQEEIELTTQPSDYIQMFLAECVKSKVEYVVMEVSSHSLAQNRTHGIFFDAVGFTNLSPEHMDFHPTMEHYFQTKFQIFDQVKENGIAVINTDNEWGLKAFNLLKSANPNFDVLSLGQNSSASTFFSISSNDTSKLETICHSICQTALSSNFLLGDFNAYNIIMASLICKKLGIDENIIAKAIANFRGVPGRLQYFKLKNGAIAFVDFAHKPDAMEKVLKTLRLQTNDLIVVFGCGGNKDKTKRPVMGKLAAEYANHVIITDDNPRDEDRQTIANEIIAGIPRERQSSVECILDRAEAINTAARLATPNSIIALLGKGHENYYLIKGQKFHFDDFEEISKY
jgi:UDP-N-acetylmuramoyl-L-alanyl-D-glutamate--2,6-diaminopimelate ligase